MFGKFTIFLEDFSIIKMFLIKLSCYHDNYFKYFMFGKYNGFVSKTRVAACVFFLGVYFHTIMSIASK